MAADPHNDIIESATESRDQTIRQLELRLARVEQQLSLQSVQLRKLRRDPLSRAMLKLRDKLKPRLFVFEQYAPRPMRVPHHYAGESLPERPHRFAIVTPSLNQARFLEATIKSVIDQNYPALQYHVQDGGSTDATPQILTGYGDRIGYASQPDAGQADAINLGFDRIDGEIMGYLNSDDCLMPGSLSYVSKFFREHPGIDVVYSHRILIDAAGLEIGRSLLPAHDTQALKWFDPIPQETMFWRKHVWTTLGGIDRSFDYAMDWDFILRAQKAGFRFARLPRFLGAFRVHDRQKTSRMLAKGEAEMRRLRILHLGIDPAPAQIERAIAPYLRRHVIVHRLYKLKLLGMGRSE